MKRISSYVVLKKEPTECIGGFIWRAYFRGTNNRIKREDGAIVQGYTKQSTLRFDLMNNPMEPGVVIT
jgi:hypothetical protein